MNTNELDKVYIGSNEVTKLYLGSDVVWEKGIPEDFNWEARFNLSFDGAVDDEVVGANILRPILVSGNIPNPFIVSTIVNTGGTTIDGVQLQIADSNQLKGATNDAAPPSTPDPNLYRHRWWSNNPYSIIFTGLDDSKRYQIQLVNHEPGRSMGDIVTSVYYRMGTEASNRFVISGDSAASTPESYEFDDLEQIRHDEMKSEGGQIKIVITRSGSVNINSLSYFVVREFDVVVEGVQTLRTAGSTDSPLPFVEYVPANTSTPKPAFIWLHGAGERGNGTTQLPNAMKYGPNWSASMGMFKQDAYAFSPQINTSGYWYDNGQNLTDFISYITTNYNVDPDRIYLIGYSDGASGIGIGVSAATTRQIAAGIAMSYDPAIWGDNADPDYESHFDINKIAAVPTWTFRNSGESVSWGGQPYTLQYILDGVAELNSINPGIAKFTQFNDFTHNYPQKVINSTGMGPMVDSNYDPFDQDIYSWLLSHTL